MKTILFSPITFNLATTGRLIAIARAIADDFHCHFASYGGPFEPLIEEAGFPLTRLEPRLTPQKIKRLYAIDQARWIGPLHSPEFVRQMVRSELALYQSLQPTAVVTGINPSTCISCPTAQIPLVWVIQSGMALNTAARLGKLKNIDVLDTVPLRWLPDRLRVKLSEMILDGVFTFAAGSYNRVAVEYGLQPFRYLEDLFRRGYHLLAAEPPGFSKLLLPPNAHFIGPLITRLDVPLPDEVLNLPRDLPIVYFAMGSSGRADIVARIVAGFAGKPYRVIAPVKHLLDKRFVKIPANVLVTGWLPAHQVNRMADISVIHGGIGTVMTACLAGKPVVGVAMSPEQLINLENLVQKGFAIRIPRASLTAERLCRSIDHLLADPVAQEKAREYQQVAAEWDNPQNIRRFFCETFGRNL
jgi:UDP:flavonoid glycosyltransferase YjiC (YdhE family)